MRNKNKFQQNEQNLKINKVFEQKIISLNIMNIH